VVVLRFVDYLILFLLIFGLIKFFAFILKNLFRGKSVFKSISIPFFIDIGFSGKIFIFKTQWANCSFVVGLHYQYPETYTEQTYF